MPRTLKQLENDLKLSIKLREYHSKVKQLKSNENIILNNIIDLDNNIINDDSPIIQEHEPKRGRGRPKGSLNFFLIDSKNDIQNSNIIISELCEDVSV